MSEALDLARLALLESTLVGTTRDMNAPTSKLRDPEPSNHPDPRMRLKLADLKPLFNSPPPPVVRFRLPKE